ncbi:MAG: hypothetical protein ACKER6_00585, partial [Candidatus Hodgkinia cicadicola]
MTATSFRFVRLLPQPPFREVNLALWSCRHWDVPLTGTYLCSTSKWSGDCGCAVGLTKLSTVWTASNG